MSVPSQSSAISLLTVITAFSCYLLKRRKLIVGNTKAFVLDKSILLSDTYSYGTSDLTAGSSTLATGTLYFVYE